MESELRTNEDVLELVKYERVASVIRKYDQKITIPARYETMFGNAVYTGRNRNNRYYRKSKSNNYNRATKSAGKSESSQKKRVSPEALRSEKLK